MENRQEENCHGVLKSLYALVRASMLAVEHRLLRLTWLEAWVRDAMRCRKRPRSRLQPSSESGMRFNGEIIPQALAHTKVDTMVVEASEFIVPERS